MNRFLFLLISVLTGVLMAVSPWFVAKRAFGGRGVLLTPFGVVNPAGVRGPFPELGWLPLAFWFWLGLIAVAVVLAFVLPKERLPKVLFALGGVALLAFGVEALVFYQAAHAINAAALAEGVNPRRLPVKRHSLSLGLYLQLFYALFLFASAKLAEPGGRALFVRYRGVVVPAVSMALAMLAGAVIVWILKTPPGVRPPVDLFTYLVTKLDLVTYTYQLLFGPVLSLPGLFQAFLIATPLIFTGLAVAFGFKAGLFNIGAPGQLIIGAIFAMLVGVYVPGPRFLLLPLAILAAALGGAIWGAIPGWLKARFGAHEVINTIMMNYIAVSVMLFLLSKNEWSFFGHVIHLPFKYPGYEPRSYEIQEAARIPMFLKMLGFSGAGPGHLSWALPLALLAMLLVYYLFGRKLDLGRRVLYALGAGVAGYLIGGFLPGIPMQVSPALASVRLNGAFVLALFAVAFYNFYMWRTKHGYELRAVGLAPKAAEYAGVKIASKIVLAMAISGALAGLAATHYVLGGGIDEYRLKQSIPYNVGFDGIAVALMGQNTPVGVTLAALLFGVLLTGGLQLNLQLGISRELVMVLQALIVLFIAAGGFLPRYFTDPLLAAEVLKKEAQ